MRKVFGNVGIVFKGSGFYKNDSRDTRRVRESGSADGSSGASAPKSEGVTEGTKEPATTKGADGSASPGSTPAKPASNGSTSEKRTSKPAQVPDAAH